MKMTVVSVGSMDSVAMPARASAAGRPAKPLLYAYGLLLPLVLPVFMYGVELWSWALGRGESSALVVGIGVRPRLGTL